MSCSRIYQPGQIISHSLLELDEGASHHLARVLRAKVGDALVLFNGEGGEYAALIHEITKKKVIVSVGEYHARDVESPLSLILAQGISRGEKMDYTIQKAVELGVTEIVPLLTERSTVKLDEERKEKKWQHWQSIVVSAAEQSGRNRLPYLHAPQTLKTWLAQDSASHRFILAPTAATKMQKIAIKNNDKVTVMIGPEGGFSEAEIAQATTQGYQALNLGPRILRTETAAVAALAILQGLYGDLTI